MPSSPLEMTDHQREKDALLHSMDATIKMLKDACGDKGTIIGNKDEQFAAVLKDHEVTMAAKNEQLSMAKYSIAILQDALAVALKDKELAQQSEHALRQLNNR